MRMRWLFKGLAFAVLACAVLAALSFVVMWLWNALVPSLFGGPVVQFWQAAGLLILSRILFGRLHGGRRGWRHHVWRDRWERMSPEERERFREGIERWRQFSAQERAEFRRSFGGCGRARTHEPPPVKET